MGTMETNHTPKFNEDDFKWNCETCGVFIDAARLAPGGDLSGCSRPLTDAEVEQGRALGLFQTPGAAKAVAR